MRARSPSPAGDDDDYEDDFEAPEDLGDDVNAVRARLETLLIEGGSAAQIHALASSPCLERNLNYASTQHRLSPLELAVQYKNQDAVRLFLSEMLSSVDQVFGLPSTPLAQCCYANDRELHPIIETLLEYRASPNARVHGPDSMTCLHCGVANEDEHIVTLLLSHEAELYEEWHGLNPLALAIDLKLPVMTKLLQDAEFKRADKRRLNKSEDAVKGGSSATFYDEVNVYDWVLQFDELDLSEALGTGGFGTVFRGKIKKSGDTVAVKRCLCQDSSVLSTFKKEVKMLSSFRHEQIVLFRGACLELPNLCIVTELMSGGNLYNLLHGQEDLPFSLRLRWGRDVARGMNYLHTLTPPVVHRDLKSLNILVNDYMMIKLCDFGMSRTKQQTVIQTKEKGGSPLWMAPECLRGEPFSEMSDVYSFGVVLWELLTRQVPWGDKEMVQLVGLVGFRGATLDVPEELPPQCPPTYPNVMTSCWKQVAAERPAFGELMPQFEDMTRMK